MNITNELEQASKLINSIASTFNLSEEKTKAVVQEVTPTLTEGLKFKLQQDSGRFRDIERSSEHFSQYLDEDDLANDTTAVNEGKQILGDIFGSKDISRKVANNVEQKTGVQHSIVEQILPMLATAVMGSLGKQFNAASQTGTGKQSDIYKSILTLLDQNKDGNVMDDVLRMFSGLFGGKK
ncbi:MAG: DUF937 domain-containing protein [Pseudomonadota bacterium]